MTIPLTLSNNAGNNIAPPESGMTAIARGQGPDVVLVHGALGDYRQWNPIVDHLQKSYRAIAVSRRYHWPNSAPSGEVSYSYESNAEDLLALLRSIGHPVHLVGHSYGAGVVLLAAIRNLKAFRSMVLIEPAFGSLLPTSEPRLNAELASREAMVKAIAERVKAGQDADASENLIDWVMETKGGFNRLPQETQTGLLANAMTVGLTFSAPAPQVTCAQLNELHIPALVVNGEHTRVYYGLIGKSAAQCIGHAEHRLILNTDHMTIVEDPKENASVLLSFFERHQ